MRLAIAAVVGGLIFSTGFAFAQTTRTTPAQQSAAARIRAQAAPIDPNSYLAKSQAATSQGFAPIDTSLLGRSSNR